MSDNEIRDERTKPIPSDKELYSASDINQFIEKERRHDQLERLNEVQRQRSVWIKTVAVSVAFNVLLIGLAVWGMLGS